MTKGLDRILEGQGDQPGGRGVINLADRGGTALALSNSNTIARVQGDTGDAQSWVVTLGVITSPGISYSTLDVRGSAISQGQRCNLNWGIDAAAFFAELDWRPCSFVVRASYVELSAVSPPVTPSSVFEYIASICPAETTSVAAVAPGGPTRTINAGSGGVLPLASVTIDVPVRARAFRVYNTFGAPPGGVGTVNVTQLTSTPGSVVAIMTGISTVGGELSGLGINNWVPLVWCTRQLTLTNPSAVATTSWSVEFLIDVG